jgi:hypothetical protein
MYYAKQFERILKGSYIKIEKLHKLKSKAESKETRRLGGGASLDGRWCKTLV